MPVVSPKLIRVRLTEDLVRAGKPHQVDETDDLYIVRGVKVVGRESPNTHGVVGAEGTVYRPEALKAALPIYEGLKVNCDHPPRERPGKERSAADRLGKLVEVKVDNGEMFGDLQLLKAHPMSARIAQAARAMPDAFALSHNAVGRGKVENGKYVIYEIPEARSVDVVADGGTNASLFEGQTMPKTTLRKLLRESKSIEAKLKKRLLEMGDDYMPDVMDAEAEPEGDWKSCLVDAIGKLVASEDAGDHDMAKKIMAMLKPQNVEEDEEEEDVEEDEGEDTAETPGKVNPDRPTKESEEEDADKEKDTKESLQRRVRALEQEKGVRDLCESLSFRPTKVQLKALLALDDDKERKTLIQESKTAGKTSAPRSAPAGSFSTSVQEGAPPKTAKDQASLLLR